MTTRSTTAARDEADARTTPARSPIRPPAGRDTTFVVLMGHLFWIGWIWLAIIVLLPIVLAGIAVFGGELTESMWPGTGLSWQRWILFAAGVTVSTTHLREFVTRGVTRRRLARSALVAMVALAVLLGIVAVVGFLEEWAVFHWQGWPQELQDSGEFGPGRIPRLALEHALLGAAYHLAGCLVGAAWQRYRWPRAIAFILPCLIPAAIVELTVSRGSGNFDLGGAPIALTLLAGAATIAAGSAAVMKVIRSLELR